MTPALATVLCLAFIGFLFRQDLKRADAPSHALWVPLIWMFLAGSRYVSSWLGMSPTFVTSADYAEGSPIDRVVFFSLIVAGVIILARRKIEWGRFLADNWWICLYLAYCFSSMTWADEPLVVLKRLIKELGNFVMVLVVLTDRKPYEAFVTLMRRLTFLLIPLSALFVKYYPALARDYRPGGEVMYTGIGHQKNDLGLMCLVAGIYLVWDVLRRADDTRLNFSRQHWLITLAFGAAIIWLLRMSDSKTSLVCLLVVGMLMLMSRLPFVSRQPGWLVGAVIVSVPLVWLLNDSYVKEFLFGLIGRNATLTNRTELWDIVIGLSGNPLVGVGFMSFWSGDRMLEVWKALGAGINQAHNGYLEQYLNLGVIGVGFVIGIMLFGLLHILRQTQSDRSAGLLCLCVIAAGALYNMTEASFFGLNNMWMLLLLGSIRPLAAQHVTVGAAHAADAIATTRMGAFRPQRRLAGPSQTLNQDMFRFKRQSASKRDTQPA